MITTKEELQREIEEEWAWRGKYLAPSGLSPTGTLWVMRVHLDRQIRRIVEHGDIELGCHTVKGIQYGWADVVASIKVLTRPR